ncbi:MAG TPA: phosphoglucosamine mutase [Bacteroidia bacterium]|nr:phosphoglucosamine mutase [Bacteroidia bacterium]
MTLIKSISGIRGTIGGNGEGLTPTEIVKYTAAFGSWIKRNQKAKDKKARIVIGRDARISGPMVRDIVVGTLQALGIDITDIGLATTPTVEIAVTVEKADGGIIITASHNPKNWNALKLLNSRGEFISEADGKDVLTIAEKGEFQFVQVSGLGEVKKDETYAQKHIDMILKLPLVDVKAIKAKKFKVVVDAVNSVGGIIVPQLLQQLGVETVFPLFCEPTGNFSHEAEPLPENLIELSKTVVKKNANLGFAVDPDVDRLAIVCEDGEMFGEEYTLVAVADYILKNKKGATVSNLSSTQALKVVTQKAGCEYFASAVGEVNVVEAMKKNNAVIGGEGNGGIIYPELHYGRDALVGIALFLTHLATFGKSCSLLRSKYPSYFTSKNKIELRPDLDIDKVLKDIKEKYKKYPSNTVDGLKIEFDGDWVHLRRSNTEPIIRIYAESAHQTTADNLAEKLMRDISEVMKQQKMAVNN